MKNKKEDKKYTFNKMVDDTINTLSISLTFILIGILLYFGILDFGNKSISSIIQWCFVGFGTLMIFIGMGKTSEDNPYNIKGFDSFGVGIFFIMIWYLLKNLTFFPIVILSVFVLIIGVYGSIRGIIEVIYSLKLNFVELKKENISKFFSELVLFLTKISALILTILNILKVLNVI